MSFLFDTGPDYADIAQKQEQARQQRITQGTNQINTAFSQFNPAFYQQRAQAYQNYAMPQLAQQYQQAQNSLLYGLANRGQLGGSVAQQQQGALTQANQGARQGIADTGIAQSQQMQQQIQQAQNQLLGQLYQSADPASAGQQATATAASFARPSVYQPLANMFSGLVSQYNLNQQMQQLGGQQQPVMYYPPQQSTYTAPVPGSY